MPIVMACINMARNKCGALIVLEAGGQVTTYEGSPDFILSDNVVATNDIVHQEMVEEVRSALLHTDC